MDRDGTVLPDGQHQLLVYKVEDSARLKDPSVSYLQLPYSAKQVQSVAVQATSSIASSSPSCASFQRNGRESVTVAFYLCSTKLTQNGIKSIWNSFFFFWGGGVCFCAGVTRFIMQGLMIFHAFSFCSQFAVVAQMEISPGTHYRYAQPRHAFERGGASQVSPGRAGFALCHVLRRRGKCNPAFGLGL